MISFGLNHMAVPSLDASEFFALASDLECSVVEIRQDTSHQNFTSAFAAQLSALAEQKNLKIIAVSEVGDFDNFDQEKLQEVERLAEFAKLAGAYAISFIPRNDGFEQTSAERTENLTSVLNQIAPILKRADLIGLIEPLGFKSASLRSKSEIVGVIEALGFEDVFKIIHDTFHHTLAGEMKIFAEHTALVHISGVEDQGLAFYQMQDKDRVLVGSKDRLGNLEQLEELQVAGYVGPVSFEPFSPVVQNLQDPRASLEGSMNFIRNQLSKCAA